MSLRPPVGCKAGATAVRMGFAKPKALGKTPDNWGSVVRETERPGRTPGGWTKATELSDVHNNDCEQSVPPSSNSIEDGVWTSADPKKLPNKVTVRPPRPGPVVGFNAVGAGDWLLMIAALKP